MHTNNQILKMQKLCMLFQTGTGLSGKELQNELSISERTRFRYIEELKNAGAKITYNVRTKMYRLNNDFNFVEHCLQYL